jgi:hypothetical protein
MCFLTNVRNTLVWAGACWEKTSRDFKEEFLKLFGIHLQDTENTGWFSIIVGVSVAYKQTPWQQFRIMLYNHAHEQFLHIIYNLQQNQFAYFQCYWHYT